jgi:ORF6N domain-containing protein
MGDDQRLEPLILVVRGQRVILDADLARLYGVTTRALNQAVKRNADRFPMDFAFQLTAEELANLKSQFVTSSLIPIKDQSDTGNRSQNVTGLHGGRRKRPTVFTEHGALMAANS